MEVSFNGLNTKFSMKYKKAYEFEIGNCYIDDSYVAYLIPNKYSSFICNAERMIDSISYEDDNMEIYFSPAIPHIFKKIETENNETAIILKKPQSFYPLKDVVKYFSGIIDGKHVAWIVTRLLNIEAFLSFNNIVHNGITVENCFIDPAQHAVAIYGGWWYSKPESEKMIGTTSSIYEILPDEVRKTGLSSYETDIRAIKALAKDISGYDFFLEDSDLPKPIIDFICDDSSHEIKELLKEWEDVKQKSYGPPRFIEMNLPKQIY